LRARDSLALYTDGLLEAHAPSSTLTVAEMIEQLKQASSRLAQDTIDSLLQLIDLEADVRDDIAVLVARVKPVGGSFI